MALKMLPTAPITNVYPAIESFLFVVLEINFGYNSACSPSSRQFATYFLKDPVVQRYLQCSSLLTFNVYSVIPVVIVVDSQREGSECASVPKLKKRF
jgi:hypothetical protein